MKDIQIPSGLLKEAVQTRGFSPLPGRCIIELDAVPAMSDLLHIPESARELRMFSYSRGQRVHGDSSWTGRVVTMTPRKNPKTGEFTHELFNTGDRVLIILTSEDLGKSYIATLNTRIYAVLEN